MKKIDCKTIIIVAGKDMILRTFIPYLLKSLINKGINIEIVINENNRWC